MGAAADFTANPIPRRADPAEAAAFIAYLLSDDASFLTGGVYTLDGGLSVR
jgi:NAD(P)-dependent dehydrogenase (short-subunit alcohol dehydrogenase family)